MASQNRDLLRLSINAVRGECAVKEVKVQLAHFITRVVMRIRD